MIKTYYDIDRQIYNLFNKRKLSIIQVSEIFLSKNDFDIFSFETVGKKYSRTWWAIPVSCWTELKDGQVEVALR